MGLIKVFNRSFNRTRDENAAVAFESVDMRDQRLETNYCRDKQRPGIDPRGLFISF